MDLANDQELANTEHKLSLLDQQIAKAKLRPPTPANLESLRSLVQMATNSAKRSSATAPPKNAAHPRARSPQT